jgi:hypothetical protein
MMTMMKNTRILLLGPKGIDEDCRNSLHDFCLTQRPMCRCYCHYRLKRAWYRFWCLDRQGHRYGIQ